MMVSGSMPLLFTLLQEGNAATGVDDLEPGGVDSLEQRLRPRFHEWAGVDEEVRPVQPEDISRSGFKAVSLRAGREEEGYLSGGAADGAGHVVEGEEGGDHLEFPVLRFLLPGGAAGQRQKEECDESRSPRHSVTPARQSEQRPLSWTICEVMAPPFRAIISPSMADTEHSGISSTLRQEVQMK